ncbi:MAG TPA: zinc ribbon domain-containing protein [Nitrosopumilaceae archaeon]|nr:zinc ribbon domain-containing protein [Nitrosopumilaceae archaeon]
MTKFLKELKNGRFVCSECQKCNKLVWPPSDYCNKCFGMTVWRPISTNAILIEFSKKDDTVFCIAEFEKTLRIIGTLKADYDKLVLGQEIKLVECSYDNVEKFVFQAV